MIKAKVLGKVSSRCGNPCTPPPSLLNLHLPVSLVLQYGSRSPGRSSATQTEAILHHHSLLTHGACVQDDLRDWLACWDMRCCPSPLSLTIQAIVHLQITCVLWSRVHPLTRLKHWPNMEAIVAYCTCNPSRGHDLV